MSTCGLSKTSVRKLASGAMLLVAGMCFGVLFNYYGFVFEAIHVRIEVLIHSVYRFPNVCTVFHFLIIIFFFIEKSHFS